MHSLLGHQRMTKKELSKSTVRPAQMRAAQAARRRLRNTRRTTPVVHVLVCSKHFCRDFESAGRRRVPPALSASKLEVEPLLVIPGLVRGLQPNGRRDE